MPGVCRTRMAAATFALRALDRVQRNLSGACRTCWKGNRQAVYGTLVPCCRSGQFPKQTIVEAVRAQAVPPRTQRVSPGHDRDRPQARADRGGEAPDQEHDPVGQGHGGGTRLAGPGQGRAQQGGTNAELVDSTITAPLQGRMGRSETYRCRSCGIVADRVVNAAMNILAAGVIAAGARTWAAGPCVAPEPYANAA